MVRPSSPGVVLGTSSVLPSWYSKAEELIKVWSGHGFEPPAFPWLSGYLICSFTEKLRLWLFWPSFMASSTFPRSNQNELLDDPFLGQALFPETQQPAETYWPLPAVLSALRTAASDPLLRLFTHGHTCQLRWLFLPARLLDGPSQAALRLCSVSNQWMPRSVPVTQFYKCQRRKKSIWQVILRNGSRGLWNSPFPHGSGIAADDESSLRTAHYKTGPKLCIQLFCLFGDC